MDYNTGYQFSVSGSGVEVIDNKSVSPSTTWSKRNNQWEFYNMDRSGFETRLQAVGTRSSVPVHRDVHGTRGSAITQ